MVFSVKLLSFYTHTHLQIRYGKREVSLREGLIADVHLPLEEQRSVTTLLPGGVQVHQPVSAVVADSWGLTVPVDHLEATKEGKELHFPVNIM